MEETRPAVTHEYIAGRPSLQDDSQHGAAVCDHVIIAPLRTSEMFGRAVGWTYVERGARVTRPTEPDEPTCPRCLAHRRCRAGTATDSDRQLLSIYRPADLFKGTDADYLGPIEVHPCPHHEGCKVRSRRKWKHQRRPTQADIARAERVIEIATDLALGDEEHDPAQWDNVLRVLETIRQERLAGPAIIDPTISIIEPCMICKMNGRSHGT